MQYPTILEYVKAIQNAGNNLDKLAHLTPVLDNHGEPYHISGAFAVVFKMQDKSTGKYYALKCFLKDQKECADDACYQIDDEQNMVGASYSTSVKYLEKELFVHSQDKVGKIPVLLSDWVDEKSMETFLSMNEDMTTEITDEELNEAIIDEYGVKYSKDGRKLLKSPTTLSGTYSIKKTTEIICDRAFSGCHNLTSVIIPNSAKNIGEWAFKYCISLSSIDIPNSVKSIGNNAFAGCSSLKYISIPKSVICLNGNPFCYWYGELECLSANFIYEGDVLFNKDKSEIISFRNKKIMSYIIPDNVTSIRDGAFDSCSCLSSFAISDSVTNIGDFAFFNCSSLSSLVIPDSVTSIRDGAFFNCSSLSSLVIPDSVVSIGDGAFRGCSSLRSLAIPNSVTSIGDSAFEECSSLSSLAISDSITSIGDFAFNGCSSLCSLVIPDSVVSIGNGAFRGCSSLRGLVIPDSVTSIGFHAFEDCSSLCSLVIPNSVVNFKGNPFYKCI